MLNSSSSPWLIQRLAACAVAAALWVSLAAPAHAQWAWRDKDGRVNASDRPPPRDVADKDIISRPAPPRAAAPRAAASAPTAGGTASAAAQAAPAPADTELQARKKAAEQEKSAKTKAEEEKATAQRADNCRRARAHLVTMDTGQRMVRINDKGEREVLDDAGRADEVRRAREVMAADCR